MKLTNSKKYIPFNLPQMTGKELQYIEEAHANGMLAGDGPFTKYCQAWIENKTHSHKALLTHSCTSALEMAALLLDIKPGDEIIMPSYTFVSTANAFVLRGGIPVFIDIRGDTLNLNEQLIESAITAKTKAIVPVHYAGVACEMDTVMTIASQHKLKVVEDAAQGIMSTYKDRALGSIGDFGAYSFHETKNIISGEGGALLVNDPTMADSAEIIREKGTDRSRFFRGEVDKYTWQEAGSSFLPGELIAAFLLAQLNAADELTKKRQDRWEIYHQLLQPLEAKGILKRPTTPQECKHNGHMYYVILSSKFHRQKVIEEFRRNEIHALFHYVPLHTSPAGVKYGRAHGSLANTDRVANQIIRLPLWAGISKDQQTRVVEILQKLL